MKFKLGIAAMLLLCVYSRLEAQNSFAKTGFQQTPLRAESVCPDAKLIMLNQSVIQLSEIHKPLILLDLFNTSCGAIAGHLQKMDALSKQFDGHFAIIAITRQDKKTIQAFIQDNKLTLPTIPVAVSDTVLCNAFPYRMVPEIVWLDSNLTVLSVSFDYDVTADNIKDALNNRLQPLRQKQDKMDYDAGNFSFLGGDTGILAASVLTGYHPELPSLGDYDTTGNYKRLLVINESLINLCRMALRFWQAPNRILVKTKNKTIFEDAPAENEGDWYATHFFCYEAKLPARSTISPEKQMLEDIGRALNVHVALEQTAMPCYVLVRTDMSKTFTATCKKPMTNFTANNNVQKWMHNLPFSSLLGYLNNIPGMPPCIDETGYTKPVDMLLNNDLNNIPALKKSLQQYGLDLLPAERVIEMLVITDN